MTTKYAATMFISKKAIDDARFDIIRYAAEVLRRRLTLAIGEHPSFAPGAFVLEAEPFREEHEVDGRGVRGFLERRGLLRRRTTVLEGTMFRAEVQVR